MPPEKEFAERLIFDNYSVGITHNSLVYILPHPEHGEHAFQIGAHFKNELVKADQGIQRFRIESLDPRKRVVIDYIPSDNAKEIKHMFDFLARAHKVPIFEKAKDLLTGNIIEVFAMPNGEYLNLTDCKTIYNQKQLAFAQ